MEFTIILFLILIIFIAYEYRLRKPDQVVLYEKKGALVVRSGRFYPRHFSQPVTKTAHSFTQTIDASAKGNLEIRVTLAVTVAASLKNIGMLIRAGGWRIDSPAKASKELEVMLVGFLKEFTERFEVEELSSEKIRTDLQQKTLQISSTLGLDVLSLTVQSFDLVKAQIAEAMRQREQARILEQTESLNQQARIVAAKVKLKADEEIAQMENDLEMKKYELKKKQFEKESQLAEKRAENEMQLGKMRLALEKEELKLLKDNPELLLLTPQAARLAEASQSLKNARTVVSLSPGEAGQGGEIIGLFQSLLGNALQALKGKK